jgi:hypothetical protein
MSSLSKLVGSWGMDVITYNCYELTHTWSHNCELAMLDIYKHAIPYSFKTYLPLYLVRLWTCAYMIHMPPV